MPDVRVLGLVASPSEQSRTRVLVQRILDAAREQGASCEVITLAGLSIDAADGRQAEEYSGDTERLLTSIDAADAIVFGMPVYRAEMPGSLKNLLDIIPRGRYDGVAQALRAKPIGLAATGASDHHFLALNGLGEMMRGFFAAYVVPPGVYASHADFAEGQLGSERVVRCADATGRALVELGRAIARSPELMQVEPLV